MRVSEARVLLRRASDAVQDVRTRLPALIAATSWRSPSAREFRVAVEEWGGVLARAAEELARWDDDLARACAVRESAGARNDPPTADTHGDWRVFGDRSP